MNKNDIKNHPEEVYTDQNKWDKRFFKLSLEIASWSDDRGRKVGAVIVGEGNTILSTGYNGLPRGIHGDDEKRHTRLDGEKYLWFEHAERNAIYNAARNGVSISGARLYSTLFPCADCGRAIIQSGLAELITLSPPAGELTYLRSMEVSLEILREANVRVRFLEV